MQKVPILATRYSEALATLVKFRALAWTIRPYATVSVRIRTAPWQII
jgi:hypothetical protein